VEADGNTVVLDTKAAVDSVKFMTAFWKETHDEGGLAWDDTSNNRAFLSGSVSATNNGASIYLEAKKKPDSYVTEKGTPMKDDIFHAGIPAGAGGQFNLAGPQTHLVMKYSKNQDAAKKFLRWAGSKEIFGKWFTSQQGYNCGATKMWEDDPVWNVDPVLLPFKSLPRTTRLVGYAGKPSQKAAEVVTKYIIVDMYAKAIQGMEAAEAVKAAHAELVSIYGA
jgi:ABC-type glycerol-3-phosphate transport system substrate-binding protein